jgi:hypothetical protein
MRSLAVPPVLTALHYEMETPRKMMRKFSFHMVIAASPCLIPSWCAAAKRLYAVILQSNMGPKSNCCVSQEEYVKGLSTVGGQAG